MNKSMARILFLVCFSSLFILSCSEDDKDDSCAKLMWFEDADNDGFGNPDVSKEACLQPEGYVSNNLDCNDNDILINPDANEICDGIDNDCDALVDGDDSDFDPNALATWYLDNDGDGFGNPNPASIIVSCTQPENYVSNGLDCNDSNPLITTTMTFYKDSDGDGYGDPNETTTVCFQPTGYVTNSLDCDDTDANVNPDVAEISGDSIDNNCNGEIDEICVPDCSGKTCGDDGCGGSCGTCGVPFICNPQGICE